MGTGCGGRGGIGRHFWWGVPLSCCLLRRHLGEGESVECVAVGGTKKRTVVFIWIISRVQNLILRMNRTGDIAFI